MKLYDWSIAPNPKRVRMYLAATVRYGNELRQALLPTEANPKN